jgi:hypothetical protein
MWRPETGLSPRAVNAHGVLAEWLDRHGVPHAPSTASRDLYDLLLQAQPGWLNVDSKYLQEAFLSRAGGRTGKELLQWLRGELRRAFRCVGQPPEWIQNPEWPIGPNGPLVFLGQLEVRKYFHDVGAAYVFHDPKSGECTTVLQVA